MRGVFQPNREEATHTHCGASKRAFVTKYCDEFKRYDRKCSQRFRQLNLKKETVGFQKVGNLYFLKTSYIRNIVINCGAP
jgi:hypothetical protein